MPRKESIERTTAMGRRQGPVVSVLDQLLGLAGLFPDAVCLSTSI